MDAQVDQINHAIADPVPTMPDVPVTSVELMRGLYDKDKDIWHTEAEVRELTGEDEEYLATLEKKKDLMYSEYMTAMLARAVIRIGDVSMDLPIEKAKAVVDKLVLGDRDLLYLAVVKATYGDTRLINAVCQSCNKMNDVNLVLDEDFPVKYPDFDVRKGLEVNTSKGAVVLRLPNGEDTVISQRESKTDAELNTVMISRCAVWPEGTAPKDPLKWARSLNIADRKKLVNALLSIDIGPKMGEVETHCASCGEKMPILIDWVSLLFS